MEEKKKKDMLDHFFTAFFSLTIVSMLFSTLGLFLRNFDIPLAFKFASDCWLVVGKIILVISMNLLAYIIISSIILLFCYLFKKGVSLYGFGYNLEIFRGKKG